MQQSPLSLDPDFLMTETLTCELLSVSARTLQAWRLRGGGPPFVKIGKSVRYKRRDITAWLSANTLTSTSQRG
ncbi:MULTISPECIES: helix-turn-helix transcriptional regulator [Martelella]|uniref:helix-turn-helix transcriptional regulator n=1 Tax=Martelella TaxID=293088 RepID=UPI00046510AA|nr:MULTISPECIES: helix-turn-helix domain-containing protein [Martelella]